MKCVKQFPWIILDRLEEKYYELISLLLQNNGKYMYDLLGH
jgi:hypothetical protein